MTRQVPIEAHVPYPETQRVKRSLRHRLHPRHLPPMSVMPTLFTLGNLIAGFAAIHYAAKPAGFQGPWGWSGLTFAAVLVFVGMLLDAVDGSVARLTRSASPIGGQLDSLADAVTFGVAPGFMALQVVARYVGADIPIIGPEADDLLGKAVWAIAVVYVCCAALRLARFNAERAPQRVERRSTFRGLPSPGAAGLVASLILLHQHLLAAFHQDVPAAFARTSALGIPLVTLLCAFAMVSTIPYAHVANRYVYGARSYAYVARLVVLLALAAWFPFQMLALLFSAYALSGPILLVRARRLLKGDGPLFRS
jgi:CDP-diacylglycerol--serine O-phosphatidyltransferase